ncbi:MAG TPA: hypothetical protein VG826_35430 [Pirellulales bacterium]|nr:hypothetical protein [Pirellulales bacterium]
MSRRFQFSIRFLLLVTVGIAAGTAAVRAEPSAKSALAVECLTVAFATVAIVGVKETCGKLRTFWIGTAIVLGPLAIYAVQKSIFPLACVLKTTEHIGTFDGHNYVWPLWCLAPANGVLAVFIQWLFSPNKDSG